MAEYSDNKEKRKSRKTWLIFLLVLLAAVTLFFIKKCNDNLDHIQNGTVSGEVTHYEAKEDGSLELYLLSDETSIVRILVTQDTRMTDILKRRIQAKQKGLILYAQIIYTEQEIRSSRKKGIEHTYRTEALYFVGQRTISTDSDSNLERPLFEFW